VDRDRVGDPSATQEQAEPAGEPEALGGLLPDAELTSLPEHGGAPTLHEAETTRI